MSGAVIGGSACCHPAGWGDYQEDHLVTRMHWCQVLIGVQSRDAPMTKTRSPESQVSSSLTTPCGTVRGGGRGQTFVKNLKILLCHLLGDSGWTSRVTSLSLDISICYMGSVPSVLLSPSGRWLWASGGQMTHGPFEKACKDLLQLFFIFDGN